MFSFWETNYTPFVESSSVRSSRSRVLRAKLLMDSTMTVWDGFFEIMEWCLSVRWAFEWIPSAGKS